MIAILSEELFSAANTLALLAILQMGMEGRHIIWTKPPYASDASSAINSWLTKLPPVIQASAKQILEFGIQESVTSETLRIVISKPDPSSNSEPPSVSLVDGLRLLRTPLTAVLENRRSDRAFLEAIALPEHRSMLRQAVTSGWLCFESSGGITELVKRLEDLRDPQPESARSSEAHLTHLRLWCLCDRDSSEPGGFSKPAKQVDVARNTFKPVIPYGPLKRRMSESYLPEAALRLWSGKPTDGHERKVRNDKVDELFKLLPSLRERFELKQGFLWGLSRERKEQLRRAPNKRITQAELKRALSPQTPEEKTNLTVLHRDKTFLRDLQDGLGADLSSIFSDQQFEESWLTSEVPREERFDLIQSILNRL